MVQESARPQAQNLIPPAKPFFPQTDIDELKGDLEQILASGMLTLGAYTKKFESEFAKFVNAPHAVAVNSGTSALEIALRALGLKSAGEVILPTNTFGATAAAVVFAGGTPIITDVSRDGLTIDSDIVRRALTPNTKGVIAVHIGGLICPDIEGIRELCDKKGLFLVEDAAHAHGSMIGNKKAGTLGSAGAFSFYPTKIITSGEGGMITTNNEEVAEFSRIMRDQGKESFSSNRIVRLGYNWRMPEICAATGLVQLRHLSDFIQKRNAIAKAYDMTLEKLGIERVVTPPNQLNNYYKYTYLLPKNINRDEFKANCRKRGVIYGGEVYWPPLHMQPAFKSYLQHGARFETADDLCQRMVNPPIFSQMTSQEVNTVIDVTQEQLSKLMG
ncbi:MAG: DegT/DnrJ/EryC1/StrS family aminotransferase [Candidatus Bathyarchaeia archaeon]